METIHTFVRDVSNLFNKLVNVLCNYFDASTVVQIQHNMTTNYSANTIFVSFFESTQI